MSSSNPPRYFDPFGLRVRAEEAEALIAERDQTIREQQEEVDAAYATITDQGTQIAERDERIKKLESGAVNHALPDAPIDENTEIVWVNGRAFINQTKHERAVDRCRAQIAKRDERIRELDAERLKWHDRFEYEFATRLKWEARIKELEAERDKAREEAGVAKRDREIYRRWARAEIENRQQALAEAKARVEGERIADRNVARLGNAAMKDRAYNRAIDDALAAIDEADG